MQLTLMEIMLMESNKIEACEVCNNKNLTTVLNLGFHPLCDDLIPIGDTRSCTEYPIEILFCKTCNTAHQKYQVPKKELFPATYHYRSRFTADVLNGMKDLVASSKAMIGSLSGQKVLDIGCNDGSLLEFFKEEGAITFGLEPTDAYQDAEARGHTIYNSFLSEKVAKEMVEAHGQFDVITFTNVFAHIENLHEVLASVKLLMTPNTTVIIENHYLGSVLKASQFDTFYHEHPRTYSYTSFEFIARLLGVDLLDVEFPARYGGNIRVFLGKSTDSTRKPLIDIQLLKVQEQQYMDMFAELRSKIDAWKNTKKIYLRDQIKHNGKYRAKAFPGRAAILIKLLGLDENDIEAVYEKPGSLKIGHYVPGTRIPILSDDAFFNLAEQPKVLLNLAWHIPNEIRSYMKEHQFSGSIIDILCAEDLVLESVDA